MQFIDPWLDNLIALLKARRQQAGQTLVEYALIIGLISLTIVALATVIITPAFTDIFSDVGNILNNASS